MTGKGFGYGKVILFGEHFVVYGLPAIASAIADRTIATVEAGKAGSGLEFIDNRPEVQGYKETKKDEIKNEFEAIIKHFNIDAQKTPLKITLSGNLECASGVGASAALASSIARALNAHFSFGMNDEQINEAAYEAEKAGSGNPSGIDNTCSTYGGMLLFEKNLQAGKNRIEPLKIKKPLKVVIASTGITQETKHVMADVKALKEKNPAEFEKIFSEYRSVFENALAALKEGDVKKIGLLIGRNQLLLEKMSLGCREITEIITVVKKAGALGAKLTGTGRGGLVICLAETEESQEAIARAITKAGYAAKKTTLGKK